MTFAAWLGTRAANRVRAAGGDPDRPETVARMRCAQAKVPGVGRKVWRVLLESLEAAGYGGLACGCRAENGGIRYCTEARGVWHGPRRDPTVGIWVRIPCEAMVRLERTAAARGEARHAMASRLLTAAIVRAT